VDPTQSRAHAETCGSAGEWFIGVLFVPLFAPFLIAITLLYRNWTTGIRLDKGGISIGTVRSSHTDKSRTVTQQSRALFTCPWAAVHAVRVVTDPAEIRLLKTSPQYYTFTNRWGTPKSRPSGRKRMDYCMLTLPQRRGQNTSSTATRAAVGEYRRPCHRPPSIDGRDLWLPAR